MSLFGLRSFIKAQKTQELTHSDTAECSLRLIMYMYDLLLILWANSEHQTIQYTETLNLAQEVTT